MNKGNLFEPFYFLGRRTIMFLLSLLLIIIGFSGITILITLELKKEKILIPIIVVYEVSPSKEITQLEDKPIVDIYV